MLSSTPVTVVLLLASVPVLFVHGSLYRILTPDSVTRDAYSLLSQIEDMRENGHRLLTGQIPRGTVFKHDHGGAVLLEWLLSFVPEGYLLSVDKYFSGLMDLLILWVLALLVPLGVVTLDQLVLVVVLFLSTPEFIRPEMPHSRGLSGRKFALVLTSLALMLFLQWHTTGSLVMLGSAVLFGALVFPSSKFAVQAFLAISLGLAAFFSPIAILFFIGTLGAAIVLTFGNYLTIARTHIRFSADFARHKQNLFNPLDPRILIPSPPTSGATDLLEYCYRNKTLKIIFNNPFIIAVAAVALVAGSTDFSVPAPPGYGIWIVSGTVAGILTALPGLRFLGGSERYFEYVFLPSAVILVNSISSLGAWYGWLLGLLVLVGFAVQGAYIWTYLNVFTLSEDAVTDKEELVSFLNNRKRGTLLAQPRHILRELNWRTDHDVVDLLGNNATSRDAVREEQRLSPRRDVMFNLTTADTEWLAEQYEPDWIIYDYVRLSTREDLSHYPRILSIPDIEPDFKNDRYEVYAFDRVRNWSRKAKPEA